jgi:hypothetical protein
LEEDLQQLQSDEYDKPNTLTKPQNNQTSDLSHPYDIQETTDRVHDITANPVIGRIRVGNVDNRVHTERQ